MGLPSRAPFARDQPRGVLVQLDGQQVGFDFFGVEMDSRREGKGKIRGKVLTGGRESPRDTCAQRCLT